MLTLSKNVVNIKPSPTLEVKKLADELRDRGEKIYDFGIGEINPEIETPGEFVEGIVSALRSGENHYAPAAGDEELLEAISNDLAKNFDLDYTPSQIVVCPGPKDALFKACLSVLESSAKRNRLIVFAPVYESFDRIPQIITGNPPVVLDTDKNFLPNLNQLEDLLKKDSTIAGVIVNSPNNPTGVVYPESLIKELASILKNHEDVVVLTDDVYRTILYDDCQYFSIASEIPEQTLLISGISKELSATGLRLGFVAGPGDVMKIIANVEGNTSSCVHLPTQKGYAKLLREDADLKIRLKIRDQLRKRRDLLLQLFEENMPSVPFVKPEGAFYLFPCFEKYIGKRTPDGKLIDSTQELSLYLLEQAHVVTVPGEAFLCPGYLRLAYGVSIEIIKEGIPKMAETLTNDD